MSALDSIWAKSRTRPTDPHGELLTVHLAAARDAARLLQERTGRIPGTPGWFWDAVALACLLHDAGKVPAGFQRMAGNPGPPVMWGQRHEVYSLGYAASVLCSIPGEVRDWVMAGIASHHRAFSGGDRRSLKGFLSNRYQSPDDVADAFAPVDAAAARELHEWLVANSGVSGAEFPGLDAIAEMAHRQLTALIDRWVDERDPPEDPVRDLTAVLLQGAVTLADHIASAHGDLLVCQPADRGYPATLVSRLRDKGQVLFAHQEQAWHVDGHMLLRAPTGKGKTEAALLWASTQVEMISKLTGGVPRVFYTLPYLASINAMSGRLSTEFGTSDLVGVAHSRAASYYLNRAADDDCGDHADPAGCAAQRAVARNRATRLFREPVRVGTPYQLVRAALAGPAHSGILVDSANSVFILDELHAYEPTRLGMILAMVSLWTRLGGRVGVVSATLPDVVAELLADALGERPHVVEPPGGQDWPVRHRLSLRGEHLTGPASATEILQRLRSGTSVLVVANTVADAQSLYEQLEPAVTAMYGDGAAILLHSRFKTGDRAGTETRIRARFEAGLPPRPGLLVATQTVEVSLNVSFGALHTSGAPLESLIQRFGRVNRLGESGGPVDVVVHEPAYGIRSGQTREYADNVYDAENVRLAWHILARHDGEQLDEKSFGPWLDEVYATEWGQRWRDEVRANRQLWDRWLRFSSPFDDRSQLADDFDQLFDGTEAILTDDIDAYRELLTDHRRAEGRLLAADLLIPVPASWKRFARWNKELDIAVIDADYDLSRGLGTVRAPDGRHYSAGEVL